MSEANELLNSILDQAGKEADGILATARAKAGEILAQARRETARRTAMIEAEAERRAAVEERRIATQAELEDRRELLQAKVNLLDEVFASAYRQLLALPEDEWRAWMRSLLVAAAVSGAEEVRVAAGQRDRFIDLLGEVNAELKRTGRRGELRLAGDPVPGEGGFILAGPDYTVDCTIQTLVAEHRPLLEPEVAKVLFDGD